MKIKSIKKTTLLFILILILAAGLRFFRLDSNPPSLYWDEASLGYNAYSILKTGKDEHGESYPLARFIAFGDYKPSGYIYAAVLSIAAFGLNEFAIRFPSALAGVGIAVVSYFLTLRLFRKSKYATCISLLTFLLTAVSPWTMLLSRGAFEANLATFFSALGLLFFLYGLEKGGFLLLSSLSFTAAFYTFNTHRVFLPLILPALFFVYGEKIIRQKKWLLISTTVGVFLLLPLIPFLNSREGKLRFQEVTIFNNLEPVERANRRIELEGGSLWAKAVHNRRVQYAIDFLKHYFDHFDLNFLFFSGDLNPRLGTRDQGLFYPIEIPFLVAGIYYLLLHRQKKALLILALWWLIGIIPAATARETPHALRTLNIVPVPYLILSYGAYNLYQKVKFKKLFLAGVLTAYLFFSTDFFHTYFYHYPVHWASSWQYGYKQAVKKTSAIEKNYDRILVTGKYGRPYIYFLLFSPVNPREYLQQKDARRDWFGFWEVSGFAKYRFGSFSQNYQEKTGKILVVASPEDYPAAAQLLDTVYYPDGSPAFLLGEI